MLGKNYLDSFKLFNLDKINRDIIQETKTIHKEETLELHDNGKIVDHVKNIGSYSRIIDAFQKYFKTYLNKGDLKRFIQSYLKGVIRQRIVRENKRYLKIDLLNRLAVFILLMFNVEIKRNSACLLSNIMFFDLVDSNHYNINMLDNLPAAAVDAHAFSIKIDHELKDHFQYYKPYDYREEPSVSVSSDFEEKLEKFMTDWVAMKIELDIKELKAIENMKIEYLNHRD